MRKNYTSSFYFIMSKIAGKRKLNFVDNRLLSLKSKESIDLYSGFERPVTMKVQKRGTRGYESLRFDKITERISHLCKGLDSSVDPTKIALDTIKNIYNGITTEELDKISANIAESYKLIHPDYSKLAARILISNLHKTTPNNFSTCMKIIKDNTELLSDEHYKFIMDNASAIDNMIIDENDYNLEYFGFKTLERSYFLHINEPVYDENNMYVYLDRYDNVVPAERVSFNESGTAITSTVNGGKTILRQKVKKVIKDRPQYIYMRVAIAIYMNSDPNINIVLEHIKLCYKLMSQMYFTHATPTLFNACGKYQQLLSCFLLGTDDSIESIMKTVTDASMISKWSGGIGIHMSNIRCENSTIKGTNGKSSGIPRQLKIYNEIARCWDQGGKRLGAIAAYIEPWHGDIRKFLQMKLNQGADSERARDLFYALWVPDLFVKRFRADKMWSLFSETTAPGLSAVFDGMLVCKKCQYCANIDYLELFNISEDKTCDHVFEAKDVFTELYTKYEKEGIAIDYINTKDIMNAICEMQRESGTPYICFKDHVNRLTNQQNIGTIKSSNLCAEIMEWSSALSYACCTLASINVKKCAKNVNGLINYNHEKLHQITRVIVRNLNNIIDQNVYPVKECENNSKDYRPIAVGIQGLADLYTKLRIPFLSEEAAKLDIEIAETIYHAALTESCELAKKMGPYTKFAGSPASRGDLQFDLWMQNHQRMNSDFKNKDPLSDRYDWNTLKSEIKKFGLRNSLFVAYMPTVSTSQILGNNESFEPIAGNIYTKNTLSGKFTICCSDMIRHLLELNLWNETVKVETINNKGSIQHIKTIPENVREIYKTVWEMSQSEIMRRAALRGAFIDQSQSLNIHLRKNTNNVLNNVLIKGWEYGLKTGSYYIRTRAAVEPMKNNLTIVRTVVKTKLSSSKSEPAKNSEDIERSQSPLAKEIDLNDSVQDITPIIEDDYDDGAACPIGCDSCSG